MGRTRKRHVRKPARLRTKRLRRRFRYRSAAMARKARTAPRSPSERPSEDTRPPVAAGIAPKAFAAGMEAAARTPIGEGEEPLRWANRCWNDWMESHSVRNLPWSVYHEAAARFAEGCESVSGIRLHEPVLVPTRRSVGAVVTAMNEEKAIPGVLEQLSRLPLDETIVVVNGSSDHTFWNARRLSRGIVVHYARPLGHDVGRAVGAKASRADIVLFLDGDFPIFAEHLVPFIDAVHKGTDVALNDISPYIEVFSHRDPVTIIKEMLNRSLDRADLQANSLTAVPHALSRRAIDAIGSSNLMVPPKAQALAIRLGLKVDCPMSVDVITKNRVRDKNSGRDNPVSHLIVGDHLEAFDILLRVGGARLTAADHIRNRSVLGRASS